MLFLLLIKVSLLWFAWEFQVPVLDRVLVILSRCWFDEEKGSVDDEVVSFEDDSLVGGLNI